MRGLGRTPFVLAAVVVMAALGGCGRSGETRPATTAPTTTTPRGSTATVVPPTDPAAPGTVVVDLRALAPLAATPPDAVIATFSWGAGSNQLGFEPGVEAASIAPAGFVLTSDHVALIDDEVNHRFVRVSTTDATLLAPLAAIHACDGSLRLGPDDVLYIACGESSSYGVSAFATTGPLAGARLAGPSGPSPGLHVRGMPVTFTPTGVVDRGGSANPLGYVTASGAPLRNPKLPSVPSANVDGAVTKITYRDGAGAALRSWDVTSPSTRIPLPFFATALPDATIVVAFLDDAYQIVAARLTSGGAVRVVRVAATLVSSDLSSSLAADMSGLYVFAAQGDTGARLVRYGFGR